MFHKRGGAFLALLATLSLILAACEGNLAGEPNIVSTMPPPPPTTPTAADVGDTGNAGNAVAEGVPQAPPNIGMGAAVFAANNCAGCHGESGNGQSESYQNDEIPYPGDMTDRLAVAEDTPAAWFQIITNGNLENLMPPWRGSLSETERWAVAMYTYTLSYAPEQVEQGETVFTEHFADVDAYDFDDPQEMVTISDQQIYDAFAADAPESVSEDDIWNAAAYARTRSVSGVDMLGTEPGQMAAAGDADTAGGMGSSADTAEGAETTVESVVGSVSGEIVNGTEGATAPDAVNVTLYVLDQAAQGMSMIDTREAETADGTYSFEDVDISPEYTYVTIANYRDRQFLSEPRRGNLDDSAIELPIEVYELTEDQSVMSIERMVIQVTAVDHGLQVAQVATFKNNSDRVFTSSQALDEEGTQFGSTVMYMPPGAAVAGFGSTNPERYVVSDEDFAVIDTLPVMPGEEHMMQVVYLLPYDNGAIIEHPVAYDFEGSVRMLLNPPDLDVESEQLERLGEQQFGEDVFAEYGTDVSLTQGDVVRYELSGQATTVTTATTNENTNRLPIILFTISGVLAATAGGLFVYGRFTGNKTEDADTDKQIDALVNQIADLDRQHDAGQLNHDLWHKQRNELKAQLQALMAKDKNSDE